MTNILFRIISGKQAIKLFGAAFFTNEMFQVYTQSTDLNIEQATYDGTVYSTKLAMTQTVSWTVSTAVM